MSTYRVVRDTDATLSWQPTDQHGEPVTATGAPTAVVTRADSTVVAGLATPTIVAGAVQLVLPAAALADLDLFTVSWLLDAVVRGRSTVDVVGGRIATLTELRDLQTPHLDNVAVSVLRARRDEVESWFERFCGRSFMPRLSVHREQPARRTVLLDAVDVIRIRWVRSIDTVPQVLPIDEIDLDTVGSFPSPWGTPVEIGYEHGLLDVPDDIVGAAAIAVRLAVASPRIRIDQFSQAQVVEGGVDTRPLFGALDRWRANAAVVA